MLTNQYGRGDATFLALGGLDGVRELVDAFYTTMEREEDYQMLWTLHTEDQETMRAKLALFLSMWSGGPKNYIDKYGQINIPAAHKHLTVTHVERDLWLACMSTALHEKLYPDDLIEYMMIQLARPAEVIRKNSAE